MRALAIALVSACMLLSGCAGSQSADRPSMVRDGRIFASNPSALVTASLALSAGIRSGEKPQDVFKRRFAPEAELASETSASIASLTSRQALFSRLAALQIEQAVISCDGKTGITSGTLPLGTDAATMTRYDIIWWLMEGAWRVALVNLDDAPVTNDESDAIKGSRGSCNDRPGEVVGGQGGVAFSSDRSLRWESAASPPGPLLVFTWNGTDWERRTVR